jgi:hypothetical protein
MPGPLDEIAELTARLARIRQLCDDLDKAAGGGENWRALVSQMKHHADPVLLPNPKKPKP